MSATEGVPAWARPVLETLHRIAMREMGNKPRNYPGDPDWADLAGHCTAALDGPVASDAGTPEGEPCPHCRASPCTTEADHCGPRPVPAQEPDAAPDAELDSLLTQLCGYEYDRGVADYVGDAGAVRDHTSSAVDTIAAIHAHVAQVKREARAEGERAATGEVIGTADVIVHYEDGDEYLPDIVPHPDCCNGRTESYTVDLVVRRDKEGVCE